MDGNASHETARRKRSLFSEARFESAVFPNPSARGFGIPDPIGNHSNQIHLRFISPTFPESYSEKNSILNVRSSRYSVELCRLPSQQQMEDLISCARLAPAVVVIAVAAYETNGRNGFCCERFVDAGSSSVPSESAGGVFASDGS